MNIRLIGATAIASLAMAGCATTSPSYGNGYGSPPPSSSATCYDCGTVTRIEQLAGGGSAPSKTGAVLGGIVGAVAGHEISAHTGGSKGNQNVAAVAGAVGGAIAGNAIQNRVDNGRFRVGAPTQAIDEPSASGAAFGKRRGGFGSGSGVMER